MGGDFGRIAACERQEREIDEGEEIYYLVAEIGRVCKTFTM